MKYVFLNWVPNYKKPAFWVAAAALAACVVAGVCFLRDLTASRTFPIEDAHSSQMEPQQIVSQIAKLEKLKDSSMLCVNADQVALFLTSDFQWVDGGAVRFFYTQNQTTYTAQLRLHPEEGQYSVTEPAEWVEQERIFNLQSYLEALKYLPQEEIRQLSPDADRYFVTLADQGGPDSLYPVITYTPDGAAPVDGWYIHLALRPLYETQGDYQGTEEVIHLFYGEERQEDSAALLGDYDFDQDGMLETVELEKHDDVYPWFELRVKKPDGTVLWRKEAHAAHSGYNSLFACKLDGKDYLLRYNPTMYQGYATYAYTLFSLDAQGKAVPVQEESVSFDVNWGSHMHEGFDGVALADFMDQLNGLLAHGRLLVTTDTALEGIDPEHPQDGGCRMGPSAAATSMTAISPCGKTCWNLRSLSAHK